MNDHSVVIVLGLTGVGKTTLLERAKEQIDKPVERLSYGTMFLEEAQHQGLVDNRDEITEMDPESYGAIQTLTAKRIGAVRSGHADKTNPDRSISGKGTTVIDTHASLDTPYGYRPGFSTEDLENIRPDQFVFVRADPSEIRERRATDDSRDRDVPSVTTLREHQEVSSDMATSFAATTRTPVAFIDNPDGEVENAAGELASLLARDA